MHCLVWVCDIFHITQLRKQLQIDTKYAACIVEFINCIIRWFMIPEDETHALQSNTSLPYFDELDSSFMLKIDINLNAVVRDCLMN